ncbi:MAG TPA: uroporphyrinogen decarboxylase [Sulfurovum sp.]|jgi:uroporphyrinogen decarboxylase|nr:MAG: uroporphyrinogen decarboxylase [Sulfurovum sp. 35-42-20]OYY57101.1 MAG: uroporphyrinogen decarboxylase [Sulfurovum sp. 28-43-6]OYZ25753.1 MAG: uroporphyrinogen decarboxylase [Sulfurovum sp. 16-42-52]OYZ50258.1 MAG: uroporphyrinogen decarboxylase [Sulfurovum sp. 24-42-9]OZA42761.1 MAG: uroporphyrinogen decarboxylase [Sulfurovum sp. 17-42-90]OZA60384.1 MAG: uroporphyrinogen decarboxylase [Sulfurovum sp. 39-42-12]HQR73307.1 uroporphyrinogen decarboxylase [Sulfurovum sp.]
MGKLFVDACLGKETPYTPVWMMRQAGRYLPEYMAVRAQAGNFLNLCHDPKKAAEVTIQPLDIVGVDAAILFSDILVIPDEMGMELSFVKGEGPKFSDPIRSQEDVERLIGGEEAADKLTYVYDTIKILREQLDARGDEKALIGFTGAPWTLATYMIEGEGTKTYNVCKKMMYANPTLLHSILAKVTEVVKYYMEKQIQAGIDVVQIFDSWAAAIEPSKYDEFSWKYMVEIADYLKSKYPHIPIIMFPKGVASFIERGGVYGNFDVFGVDWGTPMAMAKEKLGEKYVLQGNMEPCRLYSKEATTQCVEAIQEIMGGKRHIFNLGHGILPDVPVENAKHFVSECQRVSRH